MFHRLKTHLGREVTLPVWAIYYGFAVFLATVWLFRYLPTWLAWTVFLVFPFTQSWVGSMIEARRRHKREREQQCQFAAEDRQAELRERAILP